MQGSRFDTKAELASFIKRRSRISTQMWMSCNVRVVFCAKRDGHAALQYADLRVVFQHQYARSASNDEIRIQ